MSASPSHDAWALPTGPVTLPGRVPARGRVTPPGSKSHTNRLLAVAALAEGVSTLSGPLDSEDSRAMRAVAAVLGARVAADDPRAWRVTGVGGRPPGGGTADVASSGTALRFGAGLACLARAPVTLDGSTQLRRRPVGALTRALAALGGDIDDAGGRPPVSAGGGLAGGGLAGGAVTVDCAGSSQFASAVLLAAPYAARDVVVAASALPAPAYVDLTAAVMRAAGADVARLDAEVATWRVAAGAGYGAVDAAVEPDASAAAHLLALAAATGGEVTVAGLAATSQPDAGLPAVLARMGCGVSHTGDDVTVTGPDGLDAVDADLSAMPDQVTTVAALAAVAEGTSRLSGVAVARGHETDRIATLARELAELGADLTQHPGGLTITGVGPRPELEPVVLSPHDDHRLAMAFAAVAACLPEVAVAQPECVAKTYPGFWQAATALGLAVHPLGETGRPSTTERP
jgi:3-phosphoshikimate 1-carboxyvinyltransferase